MYAASTQGASTCYAVVISGDLWQFGIFYKKNKIFIKDKEKPSIMDKPPLTDNLQKVFDHLNWIFNEASNVVIEV